MDETQIIQEEEYNFPYHHISTIAPFSQSRSLWWGYEYTSYIEYIVGVLTSRSYRSFIDIGCGDGRLLAELSKQSGVPMHGTDFSERALMFARAFNPPQVTLSVDMPKRTFHSFAAIEVFEHIPVDEADSFLDSVSEILETDGFGIITVPSTNIPLNPKHYRHFTEETLRTALSSHFEIESIQYLNSQSIHSAVIQRLLANRFYILNWQVAKDALYAWYKRSSLMASSKNGSRLIAIVKKSK